MFEVARHLALIQHNDGGWTYQATDPDSLRNKTTVSDDNEFGIVATGLADAYPLLSDGGSLTAMYYTAQVLSAQAVSKTNRYYAQDTEFLYKAWKLLGFNVYKTQAQSGLQADLDFYAAMHILANYDPADAAVNAIPQSQLDAVSLPDRADAINRRFQSFRGPNLPMYDLGTRVQMALVLGRSDWAHALAQKVQQDYANLDVTQDYVLTGLAYLLKAMAPFAGTGEFDATIAQATRQLLAYQASTGQFLGPIGPGGQINNGGLADQAYILSALNAVGGQSAAVNKLLSFLLSTQLPGGRWNDFGFETVESEAELLSSLVEVSGSKQAFLTYRVGQNH